MKTIQQIAVAASVALLLVGCGDDNAAKATDTTVEATPAKQEVKVEESQEVIAKQLSELGQAMQETAKKIEAQEDEVSEADQEQMMMEALSNTQTMQNAFSVQKERMPKMVEYMKGVRECLRKADDKSEAEACRDTMETQAKALGLGDGEMDQEMEAFTWDEANKKETLEDLDKTITDMEKALPCIEKAQNMMEMAVCMQGSMTR